jgi:enoyl-CoA hydratase/carnithine racemase
MTQDILFTQRGPLGLITLNRPSALNALTLTMIIALQKQLELWKEDAGIKAVVISAAPGTAFCAGGDVRWLYQLGAPRVAEQMEFFWHEYRLNHFIHHLGKPYIALMDGMTMGGGVGISLHGTHPVASERFVFAMPETSIGFFPDIGSSHLLNRCPDALGVYLGLTGNRLGPYEARDAGLVKQVVLSEHMPLLLDAFAEMDGAVDAVAHVNRCVQHYAAHSDEPHLKHAMMIKEICALGTVEDIFAALEQHQDPRAHEVLKTLRHKSPFSLKLTLTQLQKAQGLSLADCLQMDFNIVRHFMMGHEFYEGVRALLIDKDKNPRWEPATLDLVLDDHILNYFEAGARGLEFITH